MLRKFGFGLIICTVLIGSLSCNLFCHDNDIVHPKIITKKAWDLLYDKTKSYNEIGLYLSRGSFGDDNDIADGAYREDRIGESSPHSGDIPTISMKNHFYNAWDGKGINKFRSAIEYQNDAALWSSYQLGPYSLFGNAISLYSQGNKEHAYFTLGRVAHLLQDMTSPSHVTGDNHFIPGVDNSGNNYEDWGKAHYQEIESYLAANLNTLTINNLTDLDAAMTELAQETYRNIAIQGELHRDAQHPAYGYIGKMFNDDNAIAYLEYIPPDDNFVVWGEWQIAGVGAYFPESIKALNDWWPMQAIAGMNNGEYYFIENNQSGAVPLNVWNANTNQWEKNHQGYPLAHLWTGICQNQNNASLRSTPDQTKELMPLTVEYTAGLMKYFYDLVNDPPVVKQVRVGNDRNNVYDGYWTTVLKYDNDNLSPNSTTFYVSPYGSVVSQDGRKRFNSIEELYQEINNDSDYTFVSAEREFTQTTNTVGDI